MKESEKPKEKEVIEKTKDENISKEKSQDIGVKKKSNTFEK